MNLSQIINKDDKPVPVKVIGGGITGKDVDTGEQINEVSFNVDNDGYPVLRTIDAAPYAYDPQNQTLKVNIQASDKLEVLNATLTGLPISAGQIYITRITPPAGEVWTIKNIGFNIPALTEPTSRYHEITIKHGDGASQLDILKGLTAFNKSLQYRFGVLGTMVDTQEPAEPILQRDALKDLMISEQVPLIIQYVNRTDVNVTITINIRMVISKRLSL